MLASKNALPPDFRLKVAQNHLFGGQSISKSIVTYGADGVDVRHCKWKPNSCDFSDVCRLAECRRSGNKSWRRYPHMMSVQYIASRRTPVDSPRSKFRPARSPTPDGVIRRASSCACGGECPRCQAMPAETGAMRVSRPGDPYEVEAEQIAAEVMRLPEGSDAAGIEGFTEEADRVAEQVMRLPDPTAQHTTVVAAALGTQGIPRGATGCAERLQRETRNPFDPEEGLVEEEGPIQAKQAAGHPAEAPTGLQVRISRQVRGGGRVMPESLRAHLEPRFGHDFSRVRIHTDALAADLAYSLNARAFTLGHDLVFGAGEYAPTTDAGRRLLAHELTHVIQQGEAPPLPQSPRRDQNRLHGGAREGLVGAVPLATPLRRGGYHTGHEISAISREAKTIRRVKWNPNTSTGRVSYPWGTGPSGDILEAATDAGTSLEIWRPHNGTTYWCHGYTFGGSTAKGGPYSIWGKMVPTVLNDDGWQQVYSCLAQAQDILVFFDAGGTAMHSGIVRSVSAPGSAIDEGASTLQSKWGQQPLNTSSWRTNSKQYGGYRCYSKSGAQGPCRASGANELP